jgi:hypothetical protein
MSNRTLADINGEYTRVCTDLGNQTATLELAKRNIAKLMARVYELDAEAAAANGAAEVMAARAAEDMRPAPKDDE